VKVHIESVYGFYHGQDPRTFSPDGESCTPEELARHKEACDALNRGETIAPDSSGCHHAEIGGNSAILCSTTMGVGAYEVVMTDDGDYVRDATYEDLQGDAEWEEPDQGQSVSG
jgi:hypothetical protein